MVVECSTTPSIPPCPSLEAQDVPHRRDLHATLVHLLGIDHRKLAFKYQGLDFRLTGVLPAKVIHGIIA
ncbi:MAG: DUF1501 domain-containing protein [Planctomycetales bacterium]|nr:DUF1501 domain-containing protein [Planctomycetales bacterium]